MSSKESSTLQNTSRYDVFADSVGPEPISTVVPHAMSATLKPGDMLFFPAGWWHAMRSESTSFSVSFWF
jgi:lysine-specific demethylase 8